MVEPRNEEQAYRQLVQRKKKKKEKQELQLHRRTMRPEEKEDKRLAARRMMKERENEKTRNTGLRSENFSCLVILIGVVPFSRDIEPNHLDPCGCGTGRETVRHFLFHCAQWANYRADLINKTAGRWGDLSFFLGDDRTHEIETEAEH